MGAHNHVFRLFVSPTTLIVLPYWSTDLLVKAFSKYSLVSPFRKVTHIDFVQVTGLPIS
jgi:hypothetical protein